MRKFLSALIVTVAMLFAVPSCSAQQSYTNQQQNFTVSVPGTVDESSSTAGGYALVSFSSDQTLGVLVMSPNVKVPDTRASVDGTDLSDLGANGCQDTVYNGDFARVCSISTSNPAHVKITGKVWVCVHLGYEYIVAIIASDGSLSASQVDYYLNSFVFVR